MKNNHINHPRAVIAHAHIFKNAGTTIDWILERNFGSAFLDDREDQRMLQESNYLLELVESNPSLRAISSHSLPLPIKVNSSVVFHTIAMLRHPLLRVRSVYEFERKQIASTPGAIHAKKLSFKDYVAWRMEADVSPTIRNIHVRYFTRNSLPAGKGLSSKHLDAACTFISSNKLIGLVERFDESMVVFSESLYTQGVDLDFSYKRQNVLLSTNSDEDQQIEQLELELGSVLFRILVDKNDIDMSLYKHAKHVINDRFLSVVNAQVKLENLRQSCKTLK